MTWAMDEWLKKKRDELLKKKGLNQPFNFFGDRQYFPKSEYDIEMEKKWRNPWYSYGEEVTTAPVPELSESDPLRFRQREAGRSAMPIPQAPQPMDITRYYKERDTSFAGAMAKTLASGLAKSIKPKDWSGPREIRRGGRQRVFEPETQQMASWIAPAAPSGYGETLVDPTIETYLRPWRLKHGYT